ncbi:hypothetical protein [Sphingobacterium sp. MYb388]|uniref:hypothetical protein n=1 Tax=Sphingobacterium sp. MYb388 TaxID=2745437 RepID=UPI0030A15421
MISVLTNLRELIAAYGIPHLNKEDDEQIEKDILASLKDIEIDSHTRYLSHGSREMAQQSFRIFYSQLRRMFNIIYRKKNHQADLIILKFHELFKTYEDIYSQDMNLEEPLTDYQYQLLKIEITGRFPVLKDVLHKKEIPEVLICEIQSALNSHFNSTDSELRYHQYLFYKKLLQELTKLAYDTRNKDWERRFIETMININFNHMGFFNRLSEIINDQLNTLCEKHQMMSIIINGLRISQASRHPRLYYEQNRAHLADLLSEYTEKRKILNEIQEVKIETDEILDEIESSGILSNLSRAEIIVLFHYLFKAGFLRGKSKLEAAQNFSTFVFTSNDIKIPVTQLVKIDRNKYQSSIKTVKKKLLQAILFMDEDLKDLGRSNQLEA